jgi:hypothetical protein
MAADDEGSIQQSFMERLIGPPTLEDMVRHINYGVVNLWIRFQRAGIREFNRRLGEMSRNGECALRQLVVAELVTFKEDCENNIGMLQLPEHMARMVQTYNPESAPLHTPSPPLQPDDLWSQIVIDPEATASAYVEQRISALQFMGTKALPVSDQAPAKVSKLAQALAMLVQNPNLTNLEIASAVGVHPKTLNKPTWQSFRDAKEAIKGTLPRGNKSDGDIEAIDDNDG